MSIVADIDRDRAAGLATPTGARVSQRWEDVVHADDVDVVIVATPNKIARPVAVAAALSGKHVLCEKPLGRNAAEAAEIVAAARRSGVTLKTGFNHRHHPAIARAHDLVVSGGIGEPLFIRCIYGHGGRPGYEREWRGNADLAGGGELLDQGVHAVDLARWFLGEFAEVNGRVARWVWDIAPLEDNGFAWLETADRRLAMIHTSWTQWKNRFSFEVFGHDGFVRVEGLGGSYGAESLIHARRRSGGLPDEVTTEFPGPDESWHAEWIEFTAAIREGREPLGNGEDGLAALLLIDALYRSAAEHVPVRLSEALA